MHPRTVRLDCDQRAERLHTRSRDARPYLRERATAILKRADGMTPYAVARQGLATPRNLDTVYDWLNRYQRDELPGLIQLPRRARDSPSEQADELREILHQPPERFGISRTRWRRIVWRD